jgi:hypothetical protein
MAVKTAHLTDRFSSDSIDRENNVLRKLASIVGLNKYVPAYFGLTYFNNTAPVIKSEYISLSVEEYIKANQGAIKRIGIIDIFL